MALKFEEEPSARVRSWSPSQDSARTRSRPWGCEARSGLAPIQRGRLARPWLTYRMEATPGPAALEAQRGGVQLGISRSGRDGGSPCHFSCHQPGGSRSPLGTPSAAGLDHSPLACPAATASPGSLYASTNPAPARSPGGRNPKIQGPCQTRLPATAAPAGPRHPEAGPW